MCILKSFPVILICMHNLWTQFSLTFYSLEHHDMFNVWNFDLNTCNRITLLSTQLYTAGP